MNKFLSNLGLLLATVIIGLQTYVNNAVANLPTQNWVAGAISDAVNGMATQSWVTNAISAATTDMATNSSVTNAINTATANLATNSSVTQAADNARDTAKSYADGLFTNAIEVSRSDTKLIGYRVANSTEKAAVGSTINLNEFLLGQNLANGKYEVKFDIYDSTEFPVAEIEASVYAGRQVNHGDTLLVSYNSSTGTTLLAIWDDRSQVQIDELQAKDTALNDGVAQIQTYLSTHSSINQDLRDLIAGVQLQ